MKSAREMAELLWEELPTGARALLDREAWVDGTETLFKVHARDQRHTSAEAIAALAAPAHFSVEQIGAFGECKVAAHAVAMNAPAPGEGPNAEA